MYSYIKGIIEEISLDHVVIDNNGIGYKINASANTIMKLQLGCECKIYTKLIVKEDDMSLCGFYDKEELRMFELLTSISKIGPKVGLGILSFASPKQIGAYILSEDIGKLSKAPGVGKKTAERIRDKLLESPEFDSKSHQKAFYITVLANAYYRKTYTSGSVENMGMQYNVAMTNKAVFKFYEEGSV